MDLKQIDKNKDSLLIRHARAVLPDKVAEDVDVLIKTGRIARISETADGEDDDALPTVQLPDATLYPGFIDVHIHGAAGVDTMEADSEGLARISKFLARHGVTGWLPTFVPSSDANYTRARDAIDSAIREQAAQQTPGARILGVHYEGPFVNASQCGALRNEYFKTYTRPDILNALPVPSGETIVKLITVAPEIDNGVELVRELVSRGWIVSIGHTRADFEVLERAFEAGAAHMTHFMNAMAPLHQRSPGPVGWGLSRDDVSCDIIADGIHLDPRILRLLLKVKGSDRLLLISDAIAAAGLGDGNYEIWGETIKVKEGRTSNRSGSIAGSVITMLDALRMMGSLGASEVELARLASTNPARLLGIDHDCGSIEEGKRADLVALDESGNVALTIVGGRVTESV